jgi:hypothetical protein
MATPMERAATLFRALDKRNLGVLTKQEFMEGYMQRYEKNCVGFQIKQFLLLYLIKYILHIR